MKKLSPLTIKRLREIKARILAEPENYDQGSFYHSSSPGSGECRTACCVGGWADLLFGDETSVPCFRDRAQIVLDLDPNQTRRLFYGGESGRGAQFAGIWDRELSAKKRAKLAAKRIEFFIKTNGTDDLRCVTRTKKRATKN